MADNLEAAAAEVDRLSRLLARDPRLQLCQGRLQRSVAHCRTRRPASLHRGSAAGPFVADDELARVRMVRPSRAALALPPGKKWALTSTSSRLSRVQLAQPRPQRVLAGDPDPIRIAALSFERLRRRDAVGIRRRGLSHSTLRRIHEAAQGSWASAAAPPLPGAEIHPVASCDGAARSVVPLEAATDARAFRQGLDAFATQLVEDPARSPGDVEVGRQGIEP